MPVLLTLLAALCALALNFTDWSRWPALWLAAFALLALGLAAAPKEDTHDPDADTQTEKGPAGLDDET